MDDKENPLATKPNTPRLYRPRETVNNTCIERAIEIYKGFSWLKQKPSHKSAQSWEHNTDWSTTMTVAICNN